MLANSLPDMIDPYKLARQKGTISGVIHIESTGRLKGLTCDAPCEVRVRLAFDEDEEGRANMTGSLETDLSLACHRCNAAMLYPLSVMIDLSVVRNDIVAKALMSEKEPLVTPGQITLANFVEDEIILSMPMSAMHESRACATE